VNAFAIRASIRSTMAVAAVLLVVSIAWGCSGDSTPTANTNTPSSSRPDPEPDLHAILDRLNSNDIQGFYNGLSADRRQSTTVQAIQKALDNVRRLVGVIPKLQIQEITAKRVTGDDAEVDATLNVVLPSGNLPVTDTAILKWEDGSWHLADHFLDQALAVLGLGSGSGASGTPAASR
jgi:hypothetical protein